MEHVLLISLAGLTLLTLGVVGFSRRGGLLSSIPDAPTAFVLAGICFMFGGLGGALVPTNKVIVTATPSVATIAVDGQTFTGRTEPLAVTGPSSTVVVSAPGHHGATIALNARSNGMIAVHLQPLTAADQAADVEAAAQQSASEAQRKAEAAQEARPTDPRRTPEGETAAAEQQWHQELAAEAQRQHEAAALVAEQEK